MKIFLVDVKHINIKSKCLDGIARTVSIFNPALTAESFVLCHPKKIQLECNIKYFWISFDNQLIELLLSIVASHTCAITILFTDGLFSVIH